MLNLSIIIVIAANVSILVTKIWIRKKHSDKYYYPFESISLFIINVSFILWAGTHSSELLSENTSIIVSHQLVALCNMICGQPLINLLLTLITIICCLLYLFILFLILLEVINEKSISVVRKDVPQIILTGIYIVPTCIITCF